MIDSPFENAFEYSGIGMAIVGIDGSFKRVNDEFCSICGRSRESLLNCSFQDITHADDIKVDTELFFELTNGKIDKYNREKRYIASDGTSRSVLLTASRIVFNDELATIKYVARIHHQKLIKDLSAKLENLKKISDLAFESANIGTWSYDIETKEITWDEYMSRIYEIPLINTVMHEDWLSLIHPYDRDQSEKRFKEALRTGIYESEFRIRTNSEVKYIYAKGKIISVGESKKLVAVNIDMTKDRQSRIDLEENQYILDQTQSLTKIGGWKLTVDTKEIAWSKSTYNIHEVPLNYNITEQGFLNFFPGKARKKLSDAHKDAIEKGTPYDLELPFITAKNNKLWVRCIGQPIIEHGSIVQIAGCIMDITEQISLREKLEKANAELSRFAYAASHDLREPLRKVTAFGDLLRKSLEDRLTEKEARFMNHMVTGAKRMQQQIDDLLVLSRINTTELELAEVDLTEIVKESLADVATLIIESDARIKVDKLPTIKASKPLLKSLVFNLISNAIKYRDDNRQPIIHIWHGLQDGIPALFIKDNGIGFNTKYKDMIFEPFKRLHSGERYGGSGIGLATCARVCERHGWKIGAMSIENEGSTFWFTTES